MLRTAAQISAILAAYEGLRDLAEALTGAGYRVFLYGGAVRDLLAFGTIGGDIDIAPVHKSTDPARFEEVLLAYSGTRKYHAEKFEGHHVTIRTPSGSFDILYPTAALECRLSRTEFSCHAIGFDLEQGALVDPFEGIEDLKAGRLRIHSPEFFLTNAAHYPRVFRTAALLGVPVEEPVLQAVSYFGHFIGLNEGGSVMPALVHTLKLFSTRDAEPYIAQFVETKLLSYLIPELTLLSSAMEDGQTLLARNIQRSQRVDSELLPAHWSEYLDTPLDFGGTLRGFFRLALLSEGIGEAYAALGEHSPFSEWVAIEQGIPKSALPALHEKTLFSYIAHRYRETPELAQLLREIPTLFSASKLLLRSSPQALESARSEIIRSNGASFFEKAVCLAVLNSGFAFVSQR